jgi:4-hydroxybenzoate polyprenyltransferase
MNLNWLKVFRLKEILPGAAPFFLAVLDTNVWPNWGQFLILVGGFYLLFISSFLINEYVDSFDTDKFNAERGKAITKHAVSRKFTLAAFFTASFFSTLLLFLLGQLWVALIGLTLLTLYSAKPVRLKARPFLDLAAVTIGFVLLPYLSYHLLVGQNITGITALTLAFFSLGFVAIDLVAEGADFWADKRASLKTTAVLLGEYKNLLAIQFLSLTSAFLGILTIILTGHWWYFYVVAAVFFLFTAAQFGLTIYKDKDRLHELLRTGERFGVFISDIGTGILFLIWLVTATKNWLL